MTTDMKILFTDLDGTLLDDDKNANPEDIGAIEKMIEMGHRFVIATGRPIYSAKLVAKELGLYRAGVYVLASNGGVIYDCTSEKIICANTLDNDTVAKLFAAAGEEGLHIHTYTDTHVVSLRETTELKGYCSRIKMPYRILNAIPEELPAPPPKLIVMSIKENSRQILESFEKRHADLVEGRAVSVFSNDFLLEYLPLNVSKGNALRQLCQMLDIPTGNAVAAGDEANDIPMLEAAGTAVVMKNGVDEAKAYADYITTRTNNEGAISEVISRFFL